MGGRFKRKIYKIQWKAKACKSPVWIYYLEKQWEDYNDRLWTNNCTRRTSDYPHSAINPFLFFLFFHFGGKRYLSLFSSRLKMIISRVSVFDFLHRFCTFFSPPTPCFKQTATRFLRFFFFVFKTRLNESAASANFNEWEEEEVKGYKKKRRGKER